MLSLRNWLSTGYFARDNSDRITLQDAYFAVTRKALCVRMVNQAGDAAHLSNILYEDTNIQCKNEYAFTILRYGKTSQKLVLWYLREIESVTYGEQSLPNVFSRFLHFARLF